MIRYRFKRCLTASPLDMVFGFVSSQECQGILVEKFVNYCSLFGFFLIFSPSEN